MSKYDEKERLWRQGYNQRPEVKARQKQHIKKYISKPGIREKLREYQKEYMKKYWIENPQKYIEQKIRTAQRNKERKELNMITKSKRNSTNQPSLKTN